MTPQEIKKIQQRLLEQGYYGGKVDGVWGPQSAAAMVAAQAATDARAAGTVQPMAWSDGAAPMAWGAKVGPEFRRTVRSVCYQLGIPCDWLMACMAFESGETFAPDVRNAAGSGAVGLIQFMPATAKALGTTTAALAAMSATQQLQYVYKYFLPYAKRVRTLSDVYMAILWPAAIGKPEDALLWSADSHPTTYRQNSGLDGDKNFRITKAEAAAKIVAKLEKGLRHSA